MSMYSSIASWKLMYLLWCITGLVVTRGLLPVMLRIGQQVAYGFALFHCTCVTHDVRFSSTDFFSRQKKICTWRGIVYSGGGIELNIEMTMNLFMPVIAKKHPSCFGDIFLTKSTYRGETFNHISNSFWHHHAMFQILFNSILGPNPRVFSL